LEPEADVTSNDRIEINGVMWTITASPSRTDAATTRLQVRELVL
jgi:hypothetical protein